MAVYNAVFMIFLIAISKKKIAICMQAFVFCVCVFFGSSSCERQMHVSSPLASLSLVHPSLPFSRVVYYSRYRNRVEMRHIVVIRLTHVNEMAKYKRCHE